MEICLKKTIGKINFLKLIKPAFRHDLFDLAAMIIILLTSRPSSASISTGAIVSFVGIFLYFVDIRQFVRHSAILSRALMIFGLCLGGGNAFVCGILLICMFFLYQYFIRHADEEISRAYGSAGSEYIDLVSGVVPQFVPVLLKTTSREAAGKRPFVFLNNRKIIIIIGGLIVAFVILFILS